MSWRLLPPARLRLLCLVRVLRAGVDLQLAQLLRAQRRVRQHALDRAADDLLGTPLQQLAEGLLAEAARIAAVAGVASSTRSLSPVTLILRGVDDDDVVADVDVGGVGRACACRSAVAPRAWRDGRGSGRRRRRPASGARSHLPSACRSCSWPCRSSFVVDPGLAGPDDDPPQAEPVRRDDRSGEGSSRRAKLAHQVLRGGSPHPDADERGHDAAHHLAQEGVPDDVDRHQVALPAHPDLVTGSGRRCR